MKRGGMYDCCHQVTQVIQVFDYICDEVEKMYGMRSFVANI